VNGEQKEMQFRNAELTPSEITCQTAWVESRQEAFRLKRQPPKKKRPIESIERKSDVKEKKPQKCTDKTQVYSLTHAIIKVLPIMTA